jgi:hypothetical protein
MSVGLVVATAFLLFRSFNAPVSILADPDDIIDISSDPIQTADIDTIIPGIVLSGSHFSITPKARYKISGMLISKRRYLRGYMSRLSPFDYALIWGKVPQYLDYLKFDQIVRFCLFKYKKGLPISIEYIGNHLSNNHLIPSTKNIRKALGKAKKEDLIILDGYLVKVFGKDKKGRTTSWSSSMNRTDDGNGACEIIYVTRLRINNDIYE